MAVQTAAQIRTTLVNALVVLGIPADQWRPGGALSVTLTVVANLLNMFSVLLTQVVSSGFLETSSGGWLQLLAQYVYGVMPTGSTFATGSLTFTNTGGGTYTYASGALTAKDSTTGKTYVTTQALNLGPNSTATVTIAATESGSASSAPPGEIDALVTPLLNVTVSNAASVVGLDAPNDPTLRSLCLDKLGAMSVRGPRNAYAYAIQVAVNAVSGNPVNINRWSITPSSHTGTVAIVVASPSGVPDPEDVAGVVTSIETGVPGLSPPFSGVRPDAVTVTVTGATPVNYTPAIVVWAKALPGLTATDLQTACADALSTYIEGYDVGGLSTNTFTGLFAAGVDGALKSANADAIFDVTGSIDLALMAGQVAVDQTSISVRLVTVTS